MNKTFRSFPEESIASLRVFFFPLSLVFESLKRFLWAHQRPVSAIAGSAYGNIVRRSKSMVL